MDHSILFGDGSLYTTGRKTGLFKGIDTWKDWHLIPSSRPAVAPPEVYTNYVDLPACHGKLDLSEYLTGGPVYKNRSGSWQFIPANGYGFWAERENQIKNFLHGKRRIVVLDDEPEYFYEGRLKVGMWSSNGSTNWSTIQIDYELQPFKFVLPRQTLDQYWNRFLFEDLHEYKYMKALDASQEPSFVIPGYTNGFMMDAFIDDESTFPATASVILNNQAITITRQSINDPTVRSSIFSPIINADSRITVRAAQDSNVFVTLVYWGGHL